MVSTIAYFEILVLAKLLPSLLYYLHTLTHPSNKKIDNTWNLLRLNGIIGGIPIYRIVA
jgi:hypothetical protein